MPRKAKVEPVQVTVVVSGKPVGITLHPPSERQRSWYAYWAGLGNSKSTGEVELQAAIAVAEHMLRNGGERPLPVEESNLLTDAEFVELQRVHFGRKQKPDAQRRAEKSLKTCLEAIDAFKRITGLATVSAATADDCAVFQRKALELPKSWRLPYPGARKEGVPFLAPNTVLKWSRSLQAAFERATIASGRKCVRGVVPEQKLLPSNPWRHFTWIEGTDGSKRRLSDEELLSVLDYFEKEWEGIAVASAAAKTCLWAWARVFEMASLRWDDLHTVGIECHFQIIGKWGIEKWARLPAALVNELRAFRTKSAFVFAAYPDELRAHYLRLGRSRTADLVGAEYSPKSFADWFQERIKEWSRETGQPHATPHAFRRTSLQHALSGENIRQQVAKDARLGESVMMNHYVTVRDSEMRSASNRTYERLLASLSLETAKRYGYQPEDAIDDLRGRLRTAESRNDWETVQKLAAELRNRCG